MSTSHIRVSTKGWTLDSLIKSNGNFCAVERVPARSDALLDIVKKHERNGVPLVIEGFHEHKKWPANMFTLEGFSGSSDSQGIPSLSSESSRVTSPTSRNPCSQCALKGRQNHESE